MDWDPKKGTAPPIFLRNHPSARAEAQFVTEAIVAGVAARTMRACARGDLICILPLGVAINSAGKRRLIWDGRHVNKYLRNPSGRRPFNGKVARSSSAARTVALLMFPVPTIRSIWPPKPPIPWVRVERRVLLLRSAVVRPVIRPVAIHYCDGPLGEISPLPGKRPDRLLG